MTIPPDKSYTAVEAGEILEKSERQVQRYLANGSLGGSRASGRWMTTALHIWIFQGIAEEMLKDWRLSCGSQAAPSENTQNQIVTRVGE